MIPVALCFILFISNPLHLVIRLILRKYPYYLDHVTAVDVDASVGGADIGPSVVYHAVTGVYANVDDS